MRSLMKILPARMGPTVCEELGPTVGGVSERRYGERERTRAYLRC